jgi:hypothetical protein
MENVRLQAGARSTAYRAARDGTFCRSSQCQRHGRPRLLAPLRAQRPQDLEVNMNGVE